MIDNCFGYLYVFEYSYPGLYEIELSEEDTNLTSEDILEKYGFNIDNCSFMHTEYKLELESIKE